jgi:UDP-glucose 4-epimerase
MTRLYPLRTRLQRDVAEIENYFETFSRRRPHVVCSMLRDQPAITPLVDTQITRYLALSIVPTYLGFDPRIQVVHEQDGLDALVAAVRRPVRGAGNGTIGRAKMIRLAGKPTLPVVSPLFGPVVSAATRLRLLDFSEDFERLLRYGRGVDTARLVEEVGFRPRFSTTAAVLDYVAKHRGPRLVPPPRPVVTER